MKAFEEYRTKRIEEWNNQKKRRLELRCSKYILKIILGPFQHYINDYRRLCEIIVYYCAENNILPKRFEINRRTYVYVF